LNSESRTEVNQESPATTGTMFLNQYYEDEGQETSKGWSKIKPGKPSKEVIATSDLDDSFIFRADEHGQLVAVDEDDSPNKQFYDYDGTDSKYSILQQPLTKDKSRNIDLHNKSANNGFKRMNQPANAVADRSGLGIFDRKSRSRDISTNVEKTPAVSSKPSKVPIKNYNLDVPKTQENVKLGSEDSIDPDCEEIQTENNAPVDVDLSGDSDLYTEVQNYIKGHKHAGGLRAKDQTGTVLRNIPTKMLMSCVDEDDHNRSKNKGGIFNTHTYDRASSKESLSNAKSRLEELKLVPSKPALSQTRKAEGVSQQLKPSPPPAREGSKESQSMNGGKEAQGRGGSKDQYLQPPSKDPAVFGATKDSRISGTSKDSYSLAVSWPKLSLVTNVFSITIKPTITAASNNTITGVGRIKDCPYCKRQLPNNNCGGKELGRAGVSPSPITGGQRGLTPKSSGMSRQAGTNSRPRVDPLLSHKVVNRTDVSANENGKSDRKVTGGGSRERSGGLSSAHNRSALGVQRGPLRERERNMIGVEEISKSPIMRTLNDSKLSKETLDKRSSWSKVDKPLHRSKESIAKTPDISKPKRPAIPAAGQTIAGPARSGTPGLQSKKQNMRFR
jgi:hypothetical protein